MSSEIKVGVINRETIRPSSPTPLHLKSSPLSLFDQLTPESYPSLLFFYPTNGNDRHSSVSERSKLLKRSLSETLTHFYPFAGTLQYNVSISCDDHGAGYIEARVNSPISQILNKPDIGMLKQLLPTEITSTRAEAGYLLLVQANFFECGGLAIGVSTSHKIADVYTFNRFINTWAAIALCSSTTELIPLPAEFGAGASVFPPLDLLNSSPSTAVEFVKEKVTRRRYVFDASKIAALKSKAASATVPNPTRVEVVSALIWKCAMEASRSNLGSLRPSVWCQAANMRKILGQPLAENLLGNLVGFAAAKTEESEVDHDDLQSCVAKCRKAIEEFKVNCAGGVSGDGVCEIFKEFGHLLKRDDIENYNCTSWCGCPFYEANFGWGRPSWVSSCSIDFKNIIILMDARDGVGIEATLTFKEEDMAIVESNKELLAYASPNPAVISIELPNQILPRVEVSQGMSRL